MSALQEAVKQVGGQVALASAVGVKQQHVWNWLKRGSVPPQACVAIEVATGGKVTRRHLRPDDWHRIWPELVTAEHPAPQEAARAVA